MSNIQETNFADETSLPKFVYRLGAGDKIRIIVFGEEEMSGEFEVGNNGNISLPYIREVKAQGYDISTLEQKIEARYQKEGILKTPKVSVEVLEYRPFYIHGEVTQSGEFPYKAGMDIRNAVAIAGGYTYRASTDTVYIRREGAPSVYKINLAEGKSIAIYPGDNIQIPERYF
ncbi:MAG: polysaccharide export outer membrane protein [Dasania sp.]|jgi:polysaccharide export outer membrane protein